MCCVVLLCVLFSCFAAQTNRTLFEPRPGGSTTTRNRPSALSAAAAVLRNETKRNSIDWRPRVRPRIGATAFTNTQTIAAIGAIESHKKASGNEERKQRQPKKHGWPGGARVVHVWCGVCLSVTLSTTALVHKPLSIDRSPARSTGRSLQGGVHGFRPQLSLGVLSFFASFRSVCFAPCVALGML